MFQILYFQFIFRCFGLVLAVRTIVIIFVSGMLNDHMPLRHAVWNAVCIDVIFFADVSILYSVSLYNIETNHIFDTNAPSRAEFFAKAKRIAVLDIR